MTPIRPENILNNLIFDNRFVRELPGDPESANFRRQVTGACYSRVMPLRATAPKLVAVSPDAAAMLDLDETAWQSDRFTEVFSGNRLLNGMEPFAMCYGGHQFGNWAGQLGDGRAINLGEVINRQGKRVDGPAQRGRSHPVFPQCRRPGRSAVVSAGIFMQRSHVLFRDSHHPGLEFGPHR